ncbi:MAG: hypothetical protein ACR2ND_05015 [Solirubrobacteraceae bacterium]
MNSPEHRANILDPRYKDTGLSVRTSVPAVGVSSRFGGEGRAGLAA